MQRVRVKNRPVTVSSTAFTLLKSFMLNIILRVFIRGLNDHEIRKKATRNIISSNRSLHMIYSLAEKSRRINVEIQKLFEKEFKTEKLQFYKSLTQKNLSKAQVTSLFSKYYAFKHSLPSPQHRAWSFASDSSKQVSNLFEKLSAYQPQHRHQERSVSYQSETPPSVLQNSNRTNFDRNARPPSRPYQSTLKEMSDRITFKNP